MATYECIYSRGESSANYPKYLIRDDMENEEYLNWLSISFAISTTNAGLLQYVKEKMANLHGKIWGKVRSENPGKCSINCSKGDGMWCEICKKWYSEIISYMRSDRISNKLNKMIKDFDSVKWPINVAELYKVYTLKVSDVAEDIDTDISLLFTLTENCTEFEHCFQLIDPVRKIRNKISHNEFHCVTTENKELYLDQMNNLLSYQEIAKTKGGKLAKRKLNEIRKCEINCLIKEKAEYRSLYEDTLHQSKIENEEVENGIEKSYRNICIIPRISVKDLAGFGRVYILILLASTLILELHRNKACFSSSESVLQLPEDFRFTGRSWLLSEIQNSMLINNSSIMLIPGIGYGKSSLISHLLCIDCTQPGGQIRKHLLSFHICKYEWGWTQSPGKFIINLVHSLSNKVPGYEKLTKDMQMATNEQMCSNDPLYCVDRLIIEPLSSISLDDKEIVIIDALDECPYIVKLFQHRMEKLSENFRFLLTSRTFISPICSFVKCRNLEFDDENHKNDMRILIEKYISRIANNLTYFGHDYVDFTEQLLYQSEGNALFISLVLKEMSKFPGRSPFEIPKSLNSIFERNFKRVFGDVGEQFSNVRIVFEIMIASQYPMTVKELIKVGRFCKQREEITRRLLTRQDISHFIRIRNDVLSLIHRSLRDWLLNDIDNEVFFIDIKNGHYLIARNFLEEIVSETRIDLDLIKIIPHVQASKSTDIRKLYTEKMLNVLSVNLLPVYFMKDSLLYLSSTHDCYECIVLIYQIFKSLNLTFENADVLIAKHQAESLNNSYSLKGLQYLLAMQVHHGDVFNEGAG